LEPSSFEQFFEKAKGPYIKELQKDGLSEEVAFQAYEALVQISKGNIQLWLERTPLFPSLDASKQMDKMIKEFDRTEKEKIPTMQYTSPTLNRGVFYANSWVGNGLRKPSFVDPSSLATFSKA
jgi:hypothetical protein